VKRKEKEMCPASKKLTIPLSNTGKKYGYITWKKEHDKEIRTIFENRSHVDLKFDNSYQKNKTIDWKRKRIGITWTLPRNLSEKKSKIIIERQIGNRWRVSFE
jgi:hypothetical protein